MPELLLLCIILLLLLILLVTLMGFALYSGLGAKITVGTGSPPIRNITLAYKFKQGPYKNCGALFTESCSIGPKLRSIGVFYDDPKQVAPEKCRYIVGSILCEGEEKPSDELIQLYQKFGYKIFSFPEISVAVTTTFPFTTFLSIFLAVRWVYGALAAYIEERKLCAHPFLEIYYGEQIHYMCPLSQQSEFYVPEAKEIENKTNGEQDMDAGHEISGDGEDNVTTVSKDLSAASANATNYCYGKEEVQQSAYSEQNNQTMLKIFKDTGSLSETPTENGAQPSDSGEPSITPAVVQSTTSAPSVPVNGDQEEENHRCEHSCSESGGSNSSFEELELEVNDDKKSEAAVSEHSIQEVDPSKEMMDDKEALQKEKEE